MNYLRMKRIFDKVVSIRNDEFSVDEKSKEKILTNKIALIKRSTDIRVTEEIVDFFV